MRPLSIKFNINWQVGPKCPSKIQFVFEYFVMDSPTHTSLHSKGLEPRVILFIVWVDCLVESSYSTYVSLTSHLWAPFGNFWLMTVWGSHLKSFPCHWSFFYGSLRNYGARGSQMKAKTHWLKVDDYASISKSWVILLSMVLPNAQNLVEIWICRDKG